jgi:hypothetical protein
MQPGMHAGKLLASFWRRKVSLAVYAALVDNVLRGTSDGVEAASSSARMPSPTTAF